MLSGDPADVNDLVFHVLFFPPLIFMTDLRYQGSGIFLKLELLVFVPHDITLFIIKDHVQK